MRFARWRRRLGSCVAVLALVAPMAACTGPTAAVNPRLRVTNTGGLPIEGLQILFPSETVAVGQVPAGATTPYVTVARGVYAYGAFRFTVDGSPVQQSVLDWVGEEPLDGTAFTYVLALTATPAGPPAVRIDRVVRDQ